MRIGYTTDSNKHLTYRIGVNLGDIIVEGDDIHGHGVNVAERLQAIADPGGINISGAVHDQIRTAVTAGFMNVGEQPLLRSYARLKGAKLPFSFDLTRIAKSMLLFSPAGLFFLSGIRSRGW